MLASWRLCISFLLRGGRNDEVCGANTRLYIIGSKYQESGNVRSYSRLLCYLI